MTNVIVDADAAHSLKMIEEVAIAHQIPLILVADSSHVLTSDYAQTITVDKQQDSADYKILALCDSTSIIITQDYALASLCLTKQATIINPYGFVIDDNNIEQLLTTRYLNQQARKQKIRLSNPKKLKEETILKFKDILEDAIVNKLNVQ